MDDTKQKIITLFREKGNEISTSEILDYLLPEYSSLKQKFDKDSKRIIAQAHRKLLYHINELVKEGIIRFVRFGDKGVKFFALNLAEGEEISELVKGFKKRVLVSKPIIPSMPIEAYEHQGIVIKYEPSSWIDKLNSVVIFCDNVKNLQELAHVFEKSMEVVNDCVCFENFDSMIIKEDSARVKDFLEKLSGECSDYGKKASLIISGVGLKSVHIKSFVEAALNFKTNLSVIYNLNSEELQENLGVLNELISCYIKKKSILYLKNKNIHRFSYYLGRAGPYCISDKEKFRQDSLYSIASSQSSLIVDVEKFYSIYGLDSNKFSQLMINISKSFLSANIIQKRKSQEYFKSLLSLDKKNEKEFLEFSRNYIRFWNFGLAQPGIDQKLVLNMINEAKKKIEQFSVAEETIYKSCGMPLRFKIALSCAFKESVSNLSIAKYKKLEINSLEDLYKPKLKKEILERESVSEMFDGGNDITFYRLGNFSSEEILREISFILNTYKLPLFSYSFENMKGDMKITSYF